MTKKKGTFFKNLKKSLEDVVAYKKGKIKLVAEVIEIPEPPAEYKAKDIKKIRHKRNYSQSIFARILNVNIKTVQSWESGKRNPSHAALRLIEIIDNGIYQPQIYKKN